MNDVGSWKERGFSELQMRILGGQTLSRVACWRFSVTLKAGESCRQMIDRKEYIQQHKEERFVKGDVKEAISGERMENWQTAFLIDVGCCNSDSLGSAQNAVSGLHFTFSSI